MKSEELEIQKLLEIKLHILNSPSFNYTNLPLSGLYNPILNIESKKCQLNSKFKNFEIDSPDFINIGNLLDINHKLFKKILVGELMKAILILYNNSERELYVKNLKIEVKIIESSSKGKERFIEFKSSEIPKEIIISKKKIYPIYLEVNINQAGKYKINVRSHTMSDIYDYLYFKEKQQKTIKESTPKYVINKDKVQVNEYHQIPFGVFNPFNVTEKFYNYNVNQCIISTEIKNTSSTNITILDLSLSPRSNPQNKIELVKSLEEIKNCCNKNEIDSKYITLQPEEKLMVSFRINNPDIFYGTSRYLLSISWLKLFDFNPKKFEYKFNSTLNTLNNYYKMIITEKPEGDIIQNQNFKIIINLKTRNKNKKYNISITQEPIPDDDNKSNDREIEIIDIMEKKIELSAKIPSNNFILICKSDILGSVYLPKLKFTLVENNEELSKKMVYDSLLCFNCVPK